MSEGLVGRGDFDAVVIRTDYADERAWLALVATLPQHVHLIDAPSWSGASAEDVLTATRDADDLSVVFLADTTTMRSAPPALLALTTLTPDDCEDDEDYARLTESGPTFRTTPPGIPDIHANLTLGNLGFEEYAAWAGESPDGVYRSA
ncbi:DUF6924 domain-containing protein [Streptomyces bauhiniae]|nr:hypothetical protein [Streptomyces bauhiniae]